MSASDKQGLFGHHRASQPAAQRHITEREAAGQVMGAGIQLGRDQAPGAS